MAREGPEEPRQKIAAVVPYWPNAFDGRLYSTEKAAAVMEHIAVAEPFGACASAALGSDPWEGHRQASLLPAEASAVHTPALQARRVLLPIEAGTFGGVPEI